MLEYSPVPSPPQCARAHARWVESDDYSKVSFAIEPIQLPIVPLNLFSLHELRTTAARRRGSAAGCAAAAQSRAQKLEVRELAELRRQRAVQVVPLKVPAAAYVGSDRGVGGTDHTMCSTTKRT